MDSLKVIGAVNWIFLLAAQVGNEVSKEIYKALQNA